MKLTNEELEQLIERVDDPLKRAQVGQNEFEGIDKERAQRYAALEVRVLLDGEIDISMQGISHSGMFSKIRRLPESERIALGEKYVRKLFETDNLPDCDYGLEDMFRSVGELGCLDAVRPDIEEYVAKAKERMNDPKKLDDFFPGRGPLAAAKLLGEDIEWSELDMHVFNAATNRGLWDVDESERPAIYEGAFELVKRVYQNKGSPEGLTRLLWNDHIRSKFAQDPIARELAVHAVESALGGRSHEDTKDFASTYGVSLKETLMRNTVRRLYAEGRFERAETCAEAFGYAITDDDLDAAGSEISKAVDKHLEEGNFRRAKFEALRLKSFEAYRENGLGSEEIPVVDIREGYSGKILLVSFNDKVYVRSGGSYHKDILNSFEQEVGFSGIDSYVEEEGGAHLRFEDGNRIYIHRDSVDFGECDKALAKKLVQEAFPDHTVRTDNDRGFYGF